MQVRVRNLDSREYVEEFRDNEIRIPAGEYVEKGRSEAITFLSQATPMNRDGSGRCIKPKKLKIEENPESHAAARDQPFRFETPDGKQFRTEQGHKEHLAKLETEAKAIENEKPIRRTRVSNTASTKI